MALTAQTHPESVTATLNVRVSAACQLALLAASMDPPTADQEGTVIAGSTRVHYRLRTSKLDGKGELRLRFDAPLGSRVSIRSASGLGSAVAIDDAPADKPLVILGFGSNQHTTETGAEAVIQWRLRLPASVPVRQISLPQASMQCR